MGRVARIAVIFLSCIGALTVVVIGLIVWGVSRVETPGSVEARRHLLASKVVMTIDLNRPFRQAPSDDPLQRLTGEKAYVVSTTADAIIRAANDPKVKGLFATMDTPSTGMAGAQELRDAIAKFHQSGKPTVLFSQTMDEAGNGTLAYYLASAFGDIWLQPSGGVGLQGIALEGPYFRGLLDWAGVEPQMSGRWEYKSAIETFTGKGMSAPARENLGGLLKSWMDQMSAGIAQDRHLTPEQIKALMGKGPYLAAEAQSAGLVDHLGYRNDAEDAAGFADPDMDSLDVSDYPAAPHFNGTHVAVISGMGAIHSGGKGEGFAEEEGFSSDTVANAFRDAIDDDDVEAILFRIDSPGGSYTASDTVWREVGRAREAGKPVVALMGNVAASGGYFVAMAADRIVAEPGTITGSIGVFSGKMVLKGLWSHLGVAWDGMALGDNATMYSANEPFTPGQWTKLNAILDTIYGDFTAKAAAGRHLTQERLDKLARGRVWSGADAQAVGLVDELGGMDRALAELRSLLKLAPDARLELVPYPEPRKPWEVLADLLGDEAKTGVQLRGLARSAQTVLPVLSRLQGAGGGKVQARAALP